MRWHPRSSRAPRGDTLQVGLGIEEIVSKHNAAESLNGVRELLIVVVFLSKGFDLRDECRIWWCPFLLLLSQLRRKLVEWFGGFVRLC